MYKTGGDNRAKQVKELTKQPIKCKVYKTGPKEKQPFAAMHPAPESSTQDKNCQAVRRAAPV